MTLDGFQEEHDPLDCSLSMEHDVRYHIALGQISQILNNEDMTYLDFCNIVLQLDHYYHNWSEIVGISLENRDFACNATLPSMFDPWHIDDFDDDEDD